MPSHDTAPDAEARLRDCFEGIIAIASMHIKRSTDWSVVHAKALEGLSALAAPAHGGGGEGCFCGHPEDAHYTYIRNGREQGACKVCDPSVGLPSGDYVVGPEWVAQRKYSDHDFSPTPPPLAGLTRERLVEIILPAIHNSVRHHRDWYSTHPTACSHCENPFDSSRWEEQDTLNLMNVIADAILVAAQGQTPPLAGLRGSVSALLAEIRDVNGYCPLCDASPAAEHNRGYACGRVQRAILALGQPLTLSLRAAADDLADSVEFLVRETRGVDGWHLNGAIALWDELEVTEAVATYRNAVALNQPEAEVSAAELERIFYDALWGFPIPLTYEARLALAQHLARTLLTWARVTRRAAL
ncbi:MAG: hypothetical protein Q8R28_10685 [Dehalococcoidia bacterium]|nr:hypothetical protein [Dehalococcoidia bacterium]